MTDHKLWAKLFGKRCDTGSYALLTAYGYSIEMGYKSCFGV